MLMPSIFGENLLDDFFGFPFDGDYNYNAAGLMTTDVKDTDHGYEEHAGSKEGRCES